MRKRSTTLCSRALLCSLGVVSISACATAPKTPWGLPGDQHKITVEQARESLNLALAPNMAGLTQAQHRTLRGYAAAYLDHGYGPLTLSVPDQSDTKIVAKRAVQEARKVLYEAGISWAVIAQGNYQADGMSDAPVLLNFTRYTARAEGCGARWNNLGTRPGNNESDNFGCALATNTAAMIANPYDLVRPSVTDPASTARRQTTMDKYIAGEITGAERSSDEKGTVSDAVD